MADPLYELLLPYFDKPSARPSPPSTDSTTAAYLERLSTLPLSSLNTSEPSTLSQTSHTLLISLQSLSKRSHKSVVSSSEHLSTLRTTLPQLARSTADLRDAIPKLDDSAVYFSENYNKSVENAVLNRRRKALLLSRNTDRLAALLDLPTLLSSAISSASSPGGREDYSRALELNAYTSRLSALHPDSPLVSSVSKQTEEAMQAMTTNLISSLKNPALKLAAAIRTISALRRVAPELDTPNTSNKEGCLGSLFLVCRLAYLDQKLNALEPLRELADQETLRSKAGEGTPGGKFQAGMQTEKYLKEYIGQFREHSFAIIQMYRSVFTSDTPALEDPLGPLPSALASFTLQLVGLLEGTLRRYLPNVRDKSSRDSLLTSVLYCAASLGRHGGDFSLMLAGLREDEESDEESDEEWVEVIRKHKAMAGRMEHLKVNSVR